MRRHNTPATLVAVDGTTRAGPGLWAWLLGVNCGAVLLPAGALANLLWLRVVKSRGRRVSFAAYIRMVGPVALPALVGAAAVRAVL